MSDSWEDPPRRRPPYAKDSTGGRPADERWRTWETSLDLEGEEEPSLWRRLGGDRRGGIVIGLVLLLAAALGIWFALPESSGGPNVPAAVRTDLPGLPAGSGASQTPSAGASFGIESPPPPPVITPPAPGKTSAARPRRTAVPPPPASAAPSRPPVPRASATPRRTSKPSPKPTHRRTRKPVPTTGPTAPPPPPTSSRPTSRPTRTTAPQTGPSVPPPPPGG
ncbi:hypothetical protein Skr01_70850 [Sphaerisporangium krabiense]|uniref:Uncharacterized protein n=1 Tax=Sphaerisporangium krabiense TaxID=763782 RepID=A0A7W8Z0L1_9ACTN|nr:hypothetical protein [Sphaerisporangium krabiense]MBB5624960.1 hypothetical protein [Sphaerisporangium krabiense]GII67000.1 hypothetical protein Skr01_70850 [Sphaerisporangium krabiense]